MSMTKEATYEVDGDRVKVTHGGDTQVFTIDGKGCLDGGRLLGVYCRDGGDNNARISGDYTAGQGDDGITLSFLDEQRVRVKVSQRGRVTDSAIGKYKLAGNQVTVSVTGGQPMSLRRNGDVLEGTLEGARLKFVRQ
jgi:hypothetical protein